MIIASANKNTSTWWKVYFWVIAAQVVGAPLSAIYTSTFSAKDVVDWVFIVAGAAGLFGFVFIKPIGPGAFWKAFLPAFIAWDVFMRLILPSYADTRPELTYYIAAIVLFAILVPQYVALYRYGYKTTKTFWNASADSP